MRIGTEYSSLGQSDVALDWYHRAQAGFDKLNLTKSANFGALLASIGSACARTNKFSEALAHYTRAEAIYRGVLPPDHPAACKTSRVSTLSLEMSTLPPAPAVPRRSAPQ